MIKSIQTEGAVMTKLLEDAFAEASKLSDGEQDAVASWLLEELGSERLWEQALSSSHDALAHLADQALVVSHACLDYHPGSGATIGSPLCGHWG